jgi:hypothetical protein
MRKRQAMAERARPSRSASLLSGSKRDKPFSVVSHLSSNVSMLRRDAMSGLSVPAVLSEKQVRLGSEESRWHLVDCRSPERLLKLREVRRRRRTFNGPRVLRTGRREIYVAISKS